MKEKTFNVNYKYEKIIIAKEKLNKKYKTITDEYKKHLFCKKICNVNIVINILRVVNPKPVRAKSNIRKLELNQCTKCKRTYDLKVVNATIDTCASCNEKKRDKVREKDSLRKALNRSDNNLPCSNIEKLGEYCE